MHRVLLPLDVLVGLFALSALALGAVPSYDPSLSYPVQMGILLGVAVYFALAYGIGNWQAGYLVGGILLLAGAAYAGLLILQFAYLGYTEMPGIIQRLGEMTTLLPDLSLPLPNPSAAATFLEVMIPLGIVLVITSRQRSLSVLWAVCTAVCLYALVLTFSGGAVVGLAATLLLAGILLVRSWPLRLAALALFIACVVGLVLTSADSSWALSRWTLYRNSLYVASDYLFTGIGLGDTFPLVYSRYGLLIQVMQLSYPANLVLSVWMGQGLPGLLIFAALVAAFYLFVWKVNRLKPRRLFHAAWLGVTVNLIHGLFDSRQYVEALWLMPHLFGLIGLTAALGRLALAAARSENRARRLRYIPWRLAAVLAVALVLGVIIFNRELRAAWYTNRGALLETRAELNESLNDAQRDNIFVDAQMFYQRALEVDPLWPNANRRSGNLHVKTQQFPEAIAPLEAAYLREPANPAAIKGLGLAYTWNGRAADAAHLFLRLADPVGMADELTQWGFWWGNAEQNQPLLSAYAYETAAVMYPDHVSIPTWQAAADAYRAAGQIDRARDWYERILAQEPGNAAAQQALAEIQSN